MLQIALLLLSVGLSRYMWAINVSVACTIIGLTAFGAAFFILIVIAGTSSYECPFQTPASLALRALGVHKGFGRLVSFLGIRALFRNIGIRPLFRNIGIRPLLRNVGSLAFRIKESISKAIRRHVAPVRVEGPVLPQQTPGYPTTPYFLGRPLPKPVARRTDRADALCVNWTFSRMTAPEAIDSALRLACTIRWYRNGVDPQPPSDAFGFVLRRCFEFGMVLSWKRDRAYDCARVICRLYVLAWAKSDDSEEPRRPSPLPREWADNISGDHDLRSTLALLNTFSHPINVTPRIDFTGISVEHAIWVSDTLLYLDWARRKDYRKNFFLSALLLKYKGSLPTRALANVVLAACVSLNGPVSEELLVVEDKSCVTRKSPPFSYSLTRFNIDPVWSKSHPNSLRQSSQPLIRPTLVIADFLISPRPWWTYNTTPSSIGR
jgi:hypothetical protein